MAGEQEHREITALNDGSSMTSTEESRDQKNDNLPSKTEYICNRTPGPSASNGNVFLR
jgi:hypothetical protein